MCFGGLIELSRLEAQAQKNRLAGGLGPMGRIRGFHIAAGLLKSEFPEHIKGLRAPADFSVSF